MIFALSKPIRTEAMATIPEISRLSSRIIRILGCNPGPFTLQGTNTYLIGTGRRRILLDTGDEDVPQYNKNLNKVLNDEQVTLEHILISHWHHDHIGGLKNIITSNKQVDNYRVWKYLCKENRELPYDVKYNILQDNQEFSVDGATIKIIHTPGHTTDHV